MAPHPTHPEDKEEPMKALDLLDELTKARAELSQVKAQLEVLRDQDPLTGLPNRIRLSDRTSQAILRARRQGNMVSVLFIELDRFKSVNQTLEFTETDELCLQLTRRMSVLLAAGDTLARVGTDQFAVLLPDIQDPQEPLRMAQAILDALRIPYRVGQREVRLTASIGISTSPQDGDDAPTLQKEAEHATDRAKASGGNSIQCTTLTLSEASFERQQMESFLGQAILKNEMQVFYQPQTIADGSIFGMEALLRWEHPVLGTVQAMSPRPVKLAVNVSPIQLTQPRWVDFVARTLRECRLSPSCLELEITESTLLKNAKTSQTILHDLRALGVHFGIDDFGTGYSSLSYLHQLPIDTLKIDQTFVRGMFPSQPGVISSISIVQTIIHLGRDMGMRVVAEGVETLQQKNALVDMGCYGFQGYLMGRPMEGAELGLRLESQINSAFNALLPSPPLDQAN